MRRKLQTERLTTQHQLSGGAAGIFGELAKGHDLSVSDVAKAVSIQLAQEFPSLTFRHRKSINKAEINEKLRSFDSYLGQELFIQKAKIIPDGGVIEVRDDQNDWRIVLVSEAKYQGKDLENIRNGNKVGKNKDQDLMAAGNAIERSHKNIKEIANFMLGEKYFPYVLFLEGSNFLTETVVVTRPDGSTVTLNADNPVLNRIDRLTAANYAMPINTNLCRNRFINAMGQSVMLQAASVYTQGRGEEWDKDDMAAVMLEIARTSIHMLATDLFKQITNSSI